MVRISLSCAALLALAIVSVPGVDGSEPGPAGAFDVESFYRDVRHLVRRHYPDATAHRLGNKIHFEQDTRVFVLHELSKTGAWQDPWEERGPKRGGVHCDIAYRPGRYAGQIAVPQTIDKRYFTLRLLAPYSERLDGYLYVHLKTPGIGSPPEGFEAALKALFDRFDTYTSAE